LEVGLETTDYATRVGVVFMSPEKGCFVGVRDTPLAEYHWPDEVKAEVLKHFREVFAMPHENWRGYGPSPRAQYCDMALPWSIEVDISRKKEPT
jgi:hypothetical protein